MYVCMYVCVLIRTYVCMYVCIYIYIQSYIHTCVCVNNIYIYIYTYIHSRIVKHIFIYIYIYIYTFGGLPRTGKCLSLAPPKKKTDGRPPPRTPTFREDHTVGFLEGGLLPRRPSRELQGDTPAIVRGQPINKEETNR